jgi:hypothetical protein
VRTGVPANLLEYNVRPLKPEDIALLTPQTRDFVLQLQRYPELGQGIYLSEFVHASSAPDWIPRTTVPNSRKRRFYDVVVRAEGRAGMFVATYEGDGYCAYDFDAGEITSAESSFVTYEGQTDNSIYYEHAHPDQVLRLLDGLFNERLIIFCVYERGREIESGLLAAERRETLPLTFRPGCLWPWRRQISRELRFVFKSWLGTFNGELIPAVKY